MTTLTSQALVPTTICTEHTFATEDGATIFYRAWLPPRPTRRAVVLLHRGHEHSGRLVETAERLGADGDAAVFAWDMRGHGQSSGERGHADGVGQLAKDLDEFVRHLATEHGVATEDVVVVAHSVGGVVAAAWVHDYGPPIRGLVLLAPAFRVKLYVPGAIPFLRAKQKLIGGGHVTSYVRSCCLTHDRDEQRAHDADGAIFRQISVDLLLDLHDAAKRLIADAGAITTPTLVCAAGRDWVVRRGAQQQFYERLSSRVKQFEVFDGMFHDLLHERDRARVIDRVRSFVDECFARGPATAEHDELIHADRGGYTRTEYDRLRVPAACAKWRAVRLGMRTLGRLSDGIRLGYASGFDSGLSLDYVYANTSGGVTPVGRMIDRSYLDSVGWRGIRQRRVHLETLMRRAMRELHDDGRPVRILDVAAGPGRYVLETLAKRDVPAKAVLRDYKSENVDAATRLVAELNLGERVRVERGDAFDRASLAAVTPRPTIGIVSGLYELFPDNGPLRRSLAGLADAIEPGGFLIYTCQPWHPQLEFIARALPNREGKPWVMRRRTQAEMDALVRAAGFEKVAQEIDRWGIFTVSLAKRVSR